MEYRLARRIGYTANKIVYNGPYKEDVLEAHLLAGGINNIDRIEEAKRICDISKKYPESLIKTGIRVNFDIDAGYTSRFGVDVKQMEDVISLLQRNRIIVNGLHCHMSRARGIDAWKCRASTMLNLVDVFGLDKLEYISLGSGMSGHMDPELKAQFPVVPNYKEYGNAVITQFADYYRDKDSKPIVFTEPGTTLVSKYVDFLAKIEGIKTIRGKQFVLCNCSFHNLGETCQMKNLPLRVFHDGRDIREVHEADLVGYTCLEQDVLYRNYSGPIAVGDYVEFGNVGGYSIVDKPPFIQPNCAMVSLDNLQHKLIKRRETWDDIFRSFVI